MKKTILFVLGLMAFTAVHAQQTVVIERPGIFTDLSTALIGVPAAAATGIVQGVVEAGRTLICGGTTMVVGTPAAVVQHNIVTTSPIVTGWPSTSVTTTTPAPVVVAPGVAVQPHPTTTIVTNYGNGTSVTVTRPASAYELGPNVVVPVDPAHRVGTSPFVNPYIYRHR